MDIEIAKTHINSILENYNEQSISAKSLKMANDSLDMQLKLNDFINRLSLVEYDCFTTDRDGVLKILKKFQV